MSTSGGHDPAREIARALSQVLAQSLAEDAPSRALEAGRDLAQLLSLRGLDRLLGALTRGEDGRWPDAHRHAVERVLRGARECDRDGSLDALRAADGELGVLAHALETLAASRAEAAERAPADARPTAPRAGDAGLESAADAVAAAAHATVAVPRALHPLAIAGPDPAGRLGALRLKPAIAAGLRASLDALVADEGRMRPLHVTSDGAALEVTCEGVSLAGLGPAGDVVASLGANLAPARGRSGAWTVRVPLALERASYLMLEQGEIGLAVPWHAVLRVRMVDEATLDAWRAHRDPPVLPPIVESADRSPERPAVLVGLGLRRAWLIADRLVWRMDADPAPDAPAPPSPQLGRAVASDDGERYWIVDPQRLMRDVAPPPLPVLSGPVPSRRAAEAGVAGSGAAPAPAQRDAEVASAPRPAAPPPPLRFPVERLRELRAQDVEPLGAAPATAGDAPPAPSPASPASAASDPASPGATVAHPAAEPERAGAATPPAPLPLARHALLAEDSITARIFLTRLLEQQGFDVLAVGTAHALLDALPRGNWALVAVDVDLPDARGADHVAAVVRASERVAPGTPVVALVRDAADAEIARQGGVANALHKPFAREDVEASLERAGLLRGRR